MISGTGYGLLVVIAIYAGCFFAAAKCIPSNMSSLVQVIIIVVTCFLSTGINYGVAKALNKKGVKHTVFGVRLEKVVLCIGAFLLYLAAMMLVGEVKNLNS